MPFDLCDQRFQCRENLPKAKELKRKPMSISTLLKGCYPWREEDFTSKILNKLPRTPVLLTLQAQREFCHFFSGIILRVKD